MKFCISTCVKQQKEKGGRYMFCSKCGEKLGENEKFCHKCGTPVYKKQPVDKAEPAGGYRDVRTVSDIGKRKIKRPYLLAAAGVCAACILCIFGAVQLFGNGNYKTPIKVFMEGVEKLDMHKAVSVIFPKEVEKQLGIDMDAAVDLVEDSLLGGIAEEFGDEADLSIDYKITETEQCTEDEIEDMEERYNDALHTDIRFKDAKDWKWKQKFQLAENKKKAQKILLL